jgi:hypothetical protein
MSRCCVDDSFHLLNLSVERYLIGCALLLGRNLVRCRGVQMSPKVSRAENDVCTFEPFL